MSGIEIAGLVLGALPLLISAIEHYEEGLAPAKAFWKWGDKLAEATRELWYQHTTYELTLKVLLSPITTDAELDELMSYPGGKLWKSDKIGLQLQRKLGTAYNAYLYTIKEIEEIMKSLASNLDIDKAANVQAPPPSAFRQAFGLCWVNSLGISKFEFKRRVRFVMKKRDVEGKLQQLRACNVRLESFTEKIERLEETYKSSWKSTFTIPLEQIQVCANNLHSVLTRAWGCTVHPSHSAVLLLEHRMFKPVKRMRNVQNDDSMHFTLSFSSPSIPNEWRTAGVYVPKDTTGLTTNLRGRVRFAVPPPTQPSTPVTDDDLSKFKVVTDICSTIHKPQPTGSGLGFCLDLQGELRGVYPVNRQNPAFSGNAVTLEELLASSHPRNVLPEKLTDEDRYVLAVTLASSFLQLRQTPWLNNQWNKRDIVFLRTGDDTDCAVDVQKPFVTKTYTHNNDSQQTWPSTILSSHHRSQQDDGSNLLALAVLLLEIRSGQRLEDRQRTEDLGPDGKPNEATVVQTLKQWIKQERGNLSWAFRDAVSHCMRCFADPNADLQDSDFRQGVIDNVVTPLLSELHHWQEGPSAY